jgi:periplasmic divalent cation tolerance protein
MKVNLIYITAGNKEEAKKIGKELITSKLAACVNIVDNMNSLYMWEGELQDDNETILIAKTEETHVPALIEKVKSIHSYDCPCVLSLPVSDGNKAFLNWIASEVK